MITYLIQHNAEITAPIKIGVGKTLRHRLDAKRDFPTGIRLLGIIEGNVENELHARFSDHKTAGGGQEWFLCCESILTFLLTDPRVKHKDSRQLRRAILGLLTASSDDTGSREPSVAQIVCTRTLYDLERIFEFLELVWMDVASCVCVDVDDEDKARREEEGDFPPGDCPSCCLSWAAETLQCVDYEVLVEAIGVHEDRKQLWVIAKPLTSAKRRSFLENELLMVYFALACAGWSMCIATAMDDRSACDRVVPMSMIALHRLAECYENSRGSFMERLRNLPEGFWEWDLHGHPIDQASLDAYDSLDHFRGSPLLTVSEWIDATVPLSADTPYVQASQGDPATQS